MLNISQQQQQAQWKEVQKNSKQKKIIETVQQLQLHLFCKLKRASVCVSAFTYYLQRYTQIYTILYTAIYYIYQVCYIQAKDTTEIVQKLHLINLLRISLTNLVSYGVEISVRSQF